MSLQVPQRAPWFVRVATRIAIPILLATTALANVGCNATSSGPEHRDSAVLAADVDGVIYEINPDTGGLTLLVDTALGSLEALAYSMSSGMLYGSINNSASGECDQCLYKQIDSDTISPQLIGTQLNDYVGGPYAVGYVDMAASPTGSKLYATTWDECPDLLDVNRTNAIGSELFSYTCSIYATGIAFDGTGQFYAFKHSNFGDHLALLDPTGPTETQLEDVSYVGFSVTPGDIYGMTVHPMTGRLLGLTDAGDLATIDQCTSDVTFVATPGASLVSIERVGTDPPPYAPTICDVFSNPVFVSPYNQIDLSWRMYMAGATYRLYYLYDEFDAGPTIDTGNPSTYDGVISGLSDVEYTFTGSSSCETYQFVVTAEVGGVEVASSPQISDATVCP